MGAKDHTASVKDAVHKLQLSLLHGIQNENLLFAAGSLMSRGDYEDVVTERTIANLCGYPLCTNSLPSERPRKGRYRISLKEHKVYDLHETYMYCSSSCVVHSRAFAVSLQESRCAAASASKIDGILSLFGDLSLEVREDSKKNVDSGVSELKIQEKAEPKVGEVSVQDWIGPSNAIEGFVPQIDRTSKPLRSKARKNDSKTSGMKGVGTFFNEMDFTSTILTEDEYSISKTLGPVEVVPKTSLDELKGLACEKDFEGQFEILETTSVPLQKHSDGKLRESKFEKSRTAPKEELSISKVSSRSSESMETKEESHGKKVYTSTKSMPKSSLKSMGVKKPARSVTWADAKADSVDSRDLCEVQEIEVPEEGTEGLRRTDVKDDDDSTRLASAEACVMALTNAAEAVASGESDVSDAVSEAGIVITPHPHKVTEGERQEETDVYEPQTAPPKWPTKPGTLNTDFFNSEDSWYDTPPDGFSLTLSPFATMWDVLFAWMTSSSLAYIYGQNENTHEDFLLVNGREYPQKIVLSDGRSSEIKQTLADCLARALPGLISDLRLPTPLSSLEQALWQLLDTMSFVNALPSFRMKQWQVIGLLFIEALSVCRIPAMAPHLTSRRLMLHKVLDGAQISVQEYEVMKDMIIPLGRVPRFASQGGG